MSGLKTNTIDFEILDINNTKNIVFVDTSTYSEPPENPILQITLPASSRYFIAQIQPMKVNILDSNTIGYTDVLMSACAVDFPDGVYKLVFKFCPYDYYCITKYVLRTTFIDRSIQQIYNSLDLCECPKDDQVAIKKELLDIYIFLESGKANATLGNVEKASKDYSIAAKKVDRLSAKLNL